MSYQPLSSVIHLLKPGVQYRVAVVDPRGGAYETFYTYQRSRIGTTPGLTPMNRLGNIAYFTEEVPNNNTSPGYTTTHTIQLSDPKYYIYLGGGGKRNKKTRRGKSRHTKTHRRRR